MQIKNNYWNHDKKKWLMLAKLILVGACLFFLYLKLQDQSIDLKSITWPKDFISVFMIITFLMIVNWSLEALRWKISVQPYEPIGFLKAMEIVLHGLALNMVLPFTSGDATARLIPMRNKYDTTSAMLLNRAIMLVITLIFGLYGTYMMSEESYSSSLKGIAIIGTVILTLVIFRKSLNRFTEYFNNLNKVIVGQVIGLSLLRYLVFVTQFALLLFIFLPHISLAVLLAGIGWIFFVRSILPSIIGGVGIREASGIMFFQGLVTDLSMVVIPIFLLWLLNTILPSILGLVSILKLKVKIA